MNDYLVLKKSKLYHHGLHGGLFDMAKMKIHLIGIYLSLKIRVTHVVFEVAFETSQKKKKNII